MIGAKVDGYRRYRRGMREADHGHHHHDVRVDADRRWLTTALLLIVGFMVVEVAVGIVAHSLALLSDAAHMLTDAASIALALAALRLAARPARGSYTYGLKRAEILSAQANGLTLILLAGWLGFEAYRRLVDPAPVDGLLVLLTGVAGIAINVAAAWALSRANRASLNIQGAFQHIVNDLYAFIATVVAGAIVLVTGFARADTLASLVVIVLMVRAGVRLLRDSGRVLLEAAPAGLDPDVVADRLLAVPDVVEVHDLHLWLITSGQPTLSAHVLVTNEADCHEARSALQRCLAEEYHITHTTLEVDHVASHDSLAVGTRHCADPHGAVHRGDAHDH
jgi:cobalt-zinc-cadmium efflux system protein